MNFELFPVAFYAAVLLIGIGIAFCATGLRQGWGLPGIVVLLTVGAWYVTDALYNDYESYFWEFGQETLENAWWQVVLFLLTFLVLIKPVNDGMNRNLLHHQSFAMKSYERKLGNEEVLQHQIDRVFGVMFGVWIVLILIALSRVEWDIPGLFTPFLVGHSVNPWGRGRIGGQFDALISFAQYLQIFLTAAFGLIWAVSHNPKTRMLAGACFLLSAPYFLFGRARNTMLAVLTPGLLAWVMIRLKTTWLVRAGVIAGALFAINFWMLFVLENRNIQIAQAFQLDESFEKAAEGEHAGLNMFEELGYINHFLKLGSYRPNWGARYWAEVVNPIPRGLWPGKPVVGLDYAAARGMDQGGYAADMEEGVAATISTGMIGQGVVNFGTLLGPVFAALLMTLWVGLLARQDLQAEEHPARFLLFALGIILTFNMGRDITFIVTYPFFFGYAFVYYMERKRGAGSVERGAAGSRGGSVSQKDGVSVPNGGRQKTEARGQRSEVRGEGSRGAGEGPEMRDERRDVGTGGTVRTLPTRTPTRIARWMPRRVRQQVAAEREEFEQKATKQTKGMEAENDDVKGEESRVAGGGGRPRQLAVPFRNYRRYRSG